MIRTPASQKNAGDTRSEQSQTGWFRCTDKRPGQTEIAERHRRSKSGAGRIIRLVVVKPHLTAHETAVGQRGQHGRVAIETTVRIVIGRVCATVHSDSDSI